MWARLWSRMAGGSMRGSGDFRGGMDWRGIKNKMKNILNKINGDSQSARDPNKNDYINYSIDSGIESESSSLCLEQGVKDTISKDENYGHDIMDKDDKNSINLSTYTHKFSQDDPSKDNCCPVSPQATPASIIKSQDPGRVRIKKSISFCEHKSTQNIQKQVRYNIRDQS